MLNNDIFDDIFNDLKINYRYFEIWGFCGLKEKGKRISLKCV
jgi:hypothetical protein